MDGTLPQAKMVGDENQAPPWGSHYIRPNIYGSLKKFSRPPDGNPILLSGRKTSILILHGFWSCFMLLLGNVGVIHDEGSWMTT